MCVIVENYRITSIKRVIITIAATHGCGVYLSTPLPNLTDVYLLECGALKYV